MKVLARAAGALGGGAILALGSLAALTGCSSKITGQLVPDIPPTVTLTLAPAAPDPTQKAFYAYHMYWSGYDPDGRVDHFLYAIDPPTADQAAAGAETTWVTTTKNDEILFFRATQADTTAGPRVTSSDFHVFAIKAVDNRGGVSPNVFRAFYSYTIAPTISIVTPKPSSLLEARVAPSVSITWTGSDPDGQFTQKPVKYKYILLDFADPATVYYAGHPDSLRRRYAPINFAGWDSTSADTSNVQFLNLTPGKHYLFAVIAYDEAGAYSPVFSRDSNVLVLSVDAAASLGPIMRVFNQFIDFTYLSGGYATDDSRWINVELPANRPVTFNWEANAGSGAFVQQYRWALDLSTVADQTPRTDELTDWYHWSQPSNTVTFATFGPFPQSDHFLYIDCKDNNGLASLAIVHMSFVQPTFNRELLVVDDTRKEVDRYVSGTLQNYTATWPSRSEMDTLLFAKGNVPWLQAKSSLPATSPPGFFAGYPFDTMNTYYGYENPLRGVPLSKLGTYRHIIWMVDDGAGQPSPLTDGNAIANPPLLANSALFYMSADRRASTLAAYVQLGGKVWLCGGAAATVSLVHFNNKTNDFGQTDVFSPAKGELVPSRLMYDAAHWQSEISVTVTQYFLHKSPRAVGGWSHEYDIPGEPPILDAPDYSLLPPTLRVRDPNVDPWPPSRVTPAQGGSVSNAYPVSLPIEYLSQPNFIIEDADTTVSGVREVSTLDTLYDAAGGVVVVNDSTEAGAPAMTYYHGLECPKFVFSGFPIYSWTRADALGMVDFVMQQIWGIPRQPIDRGAPATAIARTRPQPARVAAPPAARVPTIRTGVGARRR